jgi:chromosome segregation ATPase
MTEAARNDTPIGPGGKMEEQHNHLRIELRDLRQEVKERLDKLTQVITDLVRLDGVMARQNDALGRIGREVEDHEKRLRRLEGQFSGDEVRWGISSWAGTLLVSAAVGVVSSVAVGITVYLAVGR